MKFGKSSFPDDIRLAGRRAFDYQDLIRIAFQKISYFYPYFAKKHINHSTFQYKIQ